MEKNVIAHIVIVRNTIILLTVLLIVNFLFISSLRSL